MTFRQIGGEYEDGLPRILFGREMSYERANLPRGSL